MCHLAWLDVAVSRVSIRIYDRGNCRGHIYCVLNRQLACKGQKVLILPLLYIVTAILGRRCATSAAAVCWIVFEPRWPGNLLVRYRRRNREYRISRYKAEEPSGVVESYVTGRSIVRFLMLSCAIVAVLKHRFDHLPFLF